MVRAEASVCKTQVKPAWSGSAAQEALLKEAWLDLQMVSAIVLQLKVARLPEKARAGDPRASVRAVVVAEVPE